MKSLKRKSILLLILTILSIFITPAVQVVHADSDNVTYTDSEEVEYIEQSSNHEINKDDIVSPNSVTGVAIFFGGMAVGWVVDGIITYNTGRAPSEWVALGLATVESRILSLSRRGFRNIHVSTNGQVSGCITFPCML